MPRTADHIVACHAHARSLREAGKNIWPHTINVKAILNEDKSNLSAEHISSISKRIAALLRSKVPPEHFDITSEVYDFGFNDLIEFMEECTIESLALDRENGLEPEEVFNGWLEELYDWADKNRVWMGF